MSHFDGSGNWTTAIYSGTVPNVLNIVATVFVRKVVLKFISGANSAKYHSLCDTRCKFSIMEIRNVL